MLDLQFKIIVKKTVMDSRELVGHGIGKIMHEKPEMPNYGRKGTGKNLKKVWCCN